MTIPKQNTMKKSEIQKKQIRFTKSGSGHFKVSFLYYGKTYTFTTTNMLAIDAAREDESYIDKGASYETPYQALEALYAEGLRKCGIKN